MRSSLPDLLADLVNLLPQDERALVYRLAKGYQGSLVITSRERGAARRLARKLPRTFRYRDEDGTLVADRNVLAQLESVVVQDGDEALSGTGTCAQIVAAQEQGDHRRALALFEENGGVYFIHFHGNDACLDVLNRFPRAMVDAEETLTMALAMHALKAGNVTHARYLMVQHFGDEMHSLDTVISRRESYPLAVRQFRFLMAIYEDQPIPNHLREKLFDMLAEFPIDDHLHRGSFYNAMLSVCLQRRELNEAENIAKRALYHYQQAQAHLLVFYIELHCVVFSLQRGMLSEAEHRVQAAREALDRVPFEVPADRRLMSLLEGVLAYEKGEPDHLVRFVAEEFDKFAYGEIWPAVVELALVYCSQVVSRQVGLGAAISFLDKWRVQEWRSRRFNTAITMREVELLQNANRWQAAADRLMAIQSRINLTWVETAEEALSRLVDPNEIELAMAWLRHLMQHLPRRPLLRAQVEALLRNEHIGERDRGRLRLWAAYLARVHRDMTRARHLFAALLDELARIGVVTHLLGDIGLVDALVDDKRVGPQVISTAERRAILRKLHGFAPGRETNSTVLTPQELRVLRLVAEGGTNKFVARQLRLSEVTVKFHLTNTYRKMGCRRRAEAVAAARSLGWL
ncbi:LuxR C-terminal-related transcriptional regulator [Nitratireductor sp. L1-7-SE]|uniref:LuxR C-terminal-related transcriptional regulator n=1 Tax=Nitratireductor rhodophyticola TaxID=2854036 RepID=A0ABS7R7I7_9HYPH|nr:LuxR family transcriptional regulator [Nitratireductor rhodophyticola]MBY8916342.1 LuxR C-terminal-related transcriptional regulator [Nitratireductor rhodophyticola]MBY8921705.1 LuxR C-terminal-related transcriptional regulator [Nitratireductor rhodophyticola]